MSDERTPRRDAESYSHVWRAGFTLVEVLIALALFALLLISVVLLGRQFLFEFIWGGETFTGAHEADVLHATIRSDLLRVGLNGQGNDLALQITTGTLSLALSDTNIQYTFDPQRHVLWRQAGDAPPQPLGLGLVRRFEVSRVFLRKLPGPTYIVATDKPPQEKPYRAGVRLLLDFQGNPVGGSANVGVIELSTNVFPCFANLRLSSVWRKI